MAADKRNRQGGSGGRDGRGARQGGAGGRGGRQGGGWQPRPPRQGGRPGQPGGQPRGREGLPAWMNQPAPGPRPTPRAPAPPMSLGRWEAIEADSLDELAVALNDLAVNPDRLVHLIEVERPSETSDEGEVTLAGWMALVWVE